MFVFRILVSCLINNFTNYIGFGIMGVIRKEDAHEKRKTKKTHRAFQGGGIGA